MKPLLFSLLLISSMNAQWQKVDVPTTASFRGLNVVNEKVIWASGTEGTVIRTVDGGETWSVITVPGAEKLDFRGINAFDANSAVIISSGPAEKEQAKIFHTTDGGKNWKQVFEEKRTGIFFDAVAFWDKQHGIVLSDPVDGKFILFATEDGGVTWKQLPPAGLPAALPKEGAFAASNSCLVVQGPSNVWFATGGASVARVFRSSDRGKTWQVAETPMHPVNASSGIFSLAFKDEKNGIAAGGDYQKPESSDLPNVMQSHDGGKTWQAATATDPAGVYFSSVALANKKIYAGGIKGIWIRDGEWKNGSTENINTVVAGTHVSWAVGPKGIVVRKIERLRKASF
ncbi:MAG TPA: YCF48-related protein [Candidatus Angelobacter sp.]|nr:YCF48-related protein [Candidatus Angelobacter sp.]